MTPLKTYLERSRYYVSHGWAVSLLVLILILLFNSMIDELTFTIWKVDIFNRERCGMEWLNLAQG
jgi:hypothetical protein